MGLKTISVAALTFVALAATAPRIEAQESAFLAVVRELATTRSGLSAAHDRTAAALAEWDRQIARLESQSDSFQRHLDLGVMYRRRGRLDEALRQFDAAATPMFNAFTNSPNADPFVALSPAVDMTETNGLAAWGSEIKFNLAREDAADDLLFNEVIWRSIRGADSPMPAPVRAGFVLVDAERDED